ncbi:MULTISPECIES: DUF6277 family protein [Chromobacterium]|uniref:DUF6277 family protein n=1 Tax=Chromobacterium TaxID=535 RepID=UPI0018EEC711|nr:MULTISPECIES: DUF6277 family protein [Chromobacterium]
MTKAAENMINPAEILKACSAAHQYGQSAGGSMAEPFMNSVPGMSTASGSNASNMIGNVQDVGRQMLDHMTAIKSAVDKQVAVHQDQQRRQKTYDFQPDMSDLRPSDAKGFPTEMPEAFFAPFMKK